MAQPFPKFIFTHINNYTQIPNNLVAYVYKDSKGFLWISTYDGLCRYDGKNVAVYKNDPNNPNSIAGNGVSYVVEDKEGNIWAKTNKGQSCLNTFTDTFKNYYLNTSDSLLKMDVIVVDKTGTIFCTDYTGYSLKVYDKKQDKFTAIQIDTTNDGFNNTLISNALIGVLSPPQWDGSMYMYGPNGIFLFDPKTYKRKRICKSSVYTAQSIFKDHTGKLWYSEWHGGLNVIDQVTKTKINITGVFNTAKALTDKKVVSGIAEYKDANDKYWILASEMSTGSLIVVDPVTYTYQYQLLQVDGELNPNIIPGTIYCDNNGKVYVTSGISGLLVANPIRQAIQNEYTYDRTKPTDIFYDNLVRSGTQFSDNSYAFGLLEYNGMRFYDSTLTLTRAIKNYNYNGKTYDIDVRAFLKIAADKYLISGKTGIAFLQNNKITPLLYNAKKDEAKDTIVKYCRNLLPFNKDEYWVRLFGNGIKIFNTNTRLFTKHYLFADKAKQIPLSNIVKIAYDKQGQFWIMNDKAVFIYNKTTDEFTKQPINVNGTFLKSFNDFCFDESNNIWLSGDGGLLQHNLVTKKEKLFTTIDGLITNITDRVIVDAQNNIWVSCEIGLNKLNTKTNIINSYSQKDGLPLAHCEYDGAYFIDNKNNLIWGNAGAVSKINIDHLEKVRYTVPKAIITNVQSIDSNLTIEFDERDQKKITLTYKNFPVNINFSIIDFNNNYEIVYCYRYVGKDTTWIESQTGSVAINTTKPGTYSMQVTGKINGVFVPQCDSITFTILPRWFEAWWFKIIAALLSTFVLMLLYQWRIRTAKKTESQQTEIQKMAAEQYKNQLELSQITNYFSSSLTNLNTEHDVLWDVAKNLIGKLGFQDCMIYLWNADKTKLVQKAGFGEKGSIEEINKQPFDVLPGQGVVGYVAQTKTSLLIKDTRQDTRYRVDEMSRLSEICVPILHENELIGIIDSEHQQPDFFKPHHLQQMVTIASLVANKIIDLNSKQTIKQNKEELKNTIDQLKGAQLDALRSQMNPHFIFNSLNSIENFVLKNEKLTASEYLGKFSKLIRNILDNSKSEKIVLSKEIETLQLYVELERIRTGNSFDVIYEIPDNILDDNIFIPPMLMQPYAENAILHGLRHLEHKQGKLTVSLNITADDCLEYILEDNGIGRKKSAAQKNINSFEHKSYGLDITQNRIDLYNQKNNINITYKTIDLYDASYNPAGTKIIIRIPLL